VYPNEINAAGCPLYGQTGATAVQGFEAILAALPPELRAAFEAERHERQAELEAHVAAHGYHT
jgi:hypothetical protein